jgi:hypothetical protein
MRSILVILLVLSLVLGGCSGPDGLFGFMRVEAPQPCMWLVVIEEMEGDFVGAVAPESGEYTFEKKTVILDNSFLQFVVDPAKRHLRIKTHAESEVLSGIEKSNPCTEYILVRQGKENYFAIHVRDMSDGTVQVEWTTRGR